MLMKVESLGKALDWLVKPPSHRSQRLLADIEGRGQVSKAMLFSG